MHATKGELEQVLQQARERLEAGLPPTDDAEMEWAALVRQQQTLEDLKQQREQVTAQSVWVGLLTGGSLCSQHGRGFVSWRLVSLKKACVLTKTAPLRLTLTPTHNTDRRCAGPKGPRAGVCSRAAPQRLHP